MGDYHDEIGTDFTEWPTDKKSKAPETKSAWRVGRRVPLNVYDGDRAVCQCHNEKDARDIVAAMRAAPAEPDMTKLEALCKSMFLECVEDHLARIQAAAEPVRDWLKLVAPHDGNRKTLLPVSVQALLDAIGKPEGT